MMADETSAPVPPGWVRLTPCGFAPSLFRADDVRQISPVSGDQVPPRWWIIRNAFDYGMTFHLRRWRQWGVHRIYYDGWNLAVNLGPVGFWWVA